VAGLQIDFDAARTASIITRSFCTGGEILSPQFALGVTGLLDWAKPAV
jgi:hypothetical protein